MEEKDCALVIEVHEESSAGTLISITKQLFVGCNFFNNSSTFVSKDGFTLVSASVPDIKSNGIFVRGICKEEDTNKFHIPAFYLPSLRKAVDEYNEAMYNQSHKKTSDQQAVEIVVSNLTTYIDFKITELVSNKKELSAAKDVKSVQETKNKLLHILTRLPIDAHLCVYCRIYGGSCSTCPYGADNGICSNSDSNYQKMYNALQKLRWYIDEY